MRRMSSAEKKFSKSMISEFVRKTAIRGSSHILGID
ncbi:hypothetical protein LEP1GSC122_0341, partial [Leptospira kirschneri serovar Valbuzzi str. 200702274]